MKYPNWVRNMVNLKILWLIYFAGGTIVYLLLDLVWLRAGTLSAVTLWEICGCSLFLMATHAAFFENKRFEGKKSRWVYHCAASYAGVCAISLLCGWVPLSFLGVLLFTGIFAVAYAGLGIGFSVHYSIQRERMNGQLQRFKNGETF